MNEWIDFSSCPSSGKDYGGRDEKLAIVYNGRPALLKFQNSNMVGYPRQNHIAEYAASHIFSICGFQTQVTYLGTYEGRPCVVCEDFVQEGEELVTLEGSLKGNESLLQRTYSFDEIRNLLQVPTKLTGLDASSFYFDLYIMDAFLANWDRHCQNWGFIKKNGKYRFAPIYDNAGCLYSYADGKQRIEDTLQYPLLMKTAIEDYPSSRLRAPSGRNAYYHVLKECEEKELDEAILRIYPRINLEEIFHFLEDLLQENQLLLHYYKVLLKARYEDVLKPRYQRALAKL